MDGDEAQITDLLYRLARCFDHRSWDQVGDVMDADVHAYGCQGRDAVVADSLRRHLGGCGPSQHLLGNPVVEVAGDRATSLTYARVFHQGADELADRSFECLGEYHDTWVRRAQGWRMVGRVFEVAVTLGDPAVLRPG